MHVLPKSKSCTRITDRTEFSTFWHHDMADELRRAFDLRGHTDRNVSQSTMPRLPPRDDPAGSSPQYIQMIFRTQNPEACAAVPRSTPPRAGWNEVAAHACKWQQKMLRKPGWLEQGRTGGCSTHQPSSHRGGAPPVAALRCGLLQPSVRPYSG